MKTSPQMRRYLRLKNAGCCTQCGHPRGKDGTSARCRACAGIHCERQKRTYDRGAKR